MEDRIVERIEQAMRSGASGGSRPRSSHAGSDRNAKIICKNHRRSSTGKWKIQAFLGENPSKSKQIAHMKFRA
jgi:hypothetical protein